MDQECAALEGRLKSFLLQLRTELGILDRIVYKRKNQHRHGFYFQYLLKVRRDIKLLLSAGLEDILSFLFQAISRKKPNQMLYLLERLKKKKHYSTKHNFQERLLGVARLLSEMVEPILNAAIQTSSLLARSFFTGFSITILALLARVRVLIQQLLLDVVSVFNMISSLSQKQQSIKLTKEGIEVVREYYPLRGEVLTLECVWKKEKFVLLEKTVTSKEDGVPTKEAIFPVGESLIQYDNLVLADEGPDFNMHANETNIPQDYSLEGVSESTSNIRERDVHQDQFVKFGDCQDREDASPADVDLPAEVDNVSEGSPICSPKSPKPLASTLKVAFVSVAKPVRTEATASPPHKRPKLNESGISLFSLFTGDNSESLF
ncbi:hypothetical protein H6P81_018607 [Aristolochia fimbriata]|uniref:Nucleolus and neural progenitor protein-like N-terminal domain-containing protein n=1 Tax=Aristolochia fimbriata TaxID=158543 RepID=A0AAV7E2F1_ARIFI|nr:hypothetical protein H6P81_018607 [Aristolochia fimbriata]